MKLIESNNETVTLQIRRTEFNNLSRALGMAAYMLAGASDGGLQLRDDEVKTGAAFLPKIQQLLQNLTRIAIKNGWLDEEEDEDE